ncbi:MAG: hypothetical protein ACR2KG_04665 [Nocardioidaceae bacterium]
MYRPGKITTIALGVVAAAAMGSGIAAAATTPASHVTKSYVQGAQPRVADTDNLQQGDQTSPDAIAVKAPQAAIGKAAAIGDAEQSGEGNETQGEGTGQSDGPGGHQDPSGDVQHQGGDNEQ